MHNVTIEQRLLWISVSWCSLFVPFVCLVVALTNGRVEEATGPLIATACCVVSMIGGIVSLFHASKSPWLIVPAALLGILASAVVGIVAGYYSLWALVDWRM